MTALHAAAADVEAVTLQEGQALFFARGVMHEASVSENERGRCELLKNGYHFVVVICARWYQVSVSLVRSCSVHITIGIDTQDVTWQHAMHAFIDKMPPVCHPLLSRLFCAFPHVC